MNKETAEIMKKNFRTSIQIKDIQIEGNKITKKDIIEKVLENVKNSHSLGKAFIELHRANIELQKFGVFKDIEMNIDFIQEDGKNKILENGDYLCNIKVNLKENKRKQLDISSFFSKEENPELRISGTLNNAFGRLEKLWIQGNIHPTTSKDLSLQVGIMKPLLFSKGNKLITTNFFSDTYNQIHSFYKENIRGFIIHFNQKLFGGRYSILYEGSWREVIPDEKSSIKIRLSSGNSLKSSIKHIYTYETRDDEIIPSRGFSFTISQELAGLFGNVKFFKQEMDTQFNKPLPKGWALNFLLKGGFLLPLVGDTTRINDRFFLGGLTSLRGFRPCGVGPRTLNEALGGDLMFSGGIHLTTPILPIETNTITLLTRGQLYLNFGNLTILNKDIGILSNIKNLFGEEIRSSIGLGIVFKTPLGRLEVNYNYPLRTFGYDKPKSWQVGFSYKF